MDCSWRGQASCCCLRALAFAKDFQLEQKSICGVGHRGTCRESRLASARREWPSICIRCVNTQHPIEAGCCNLTISCLDALPVLFSLLCFFPCASARAQPYFESTRSRTNPPLLLVCKSVASKEPCRSLLFLNLSTSLRCSVFC